MTVVAMVEARNGCRAGQGLAGAVDGAAWPASTQSGRCHAGTLATHVANARSSRLTCPAVLGVTGGGAVRSCQISAAAVRMHQMRTVMPDQVRQDSMWGTSRV